MPVYIPAFIGIHGPTDAQFVRLGVARMYISPIGRSAFTEVGKNTHDGNFWTMAKSDKHDNLYIWFIYAHLLNSMRIPMESVVL